MIRFGCQRKILRLKYIEILKHTVTACTHPVRVHDQQAALLFAPIIVLTGAISLSRVMIRVSKDGLLPPFVAKIQRHQPVNAVLIYMFVTVLLCNFDIAVLANLSLNGVRPRYVT